MALYPPIVASSMPAFNINDGKVRIYFTLSNYNNSKKELISKVHVSVRDQKSNVSVISGLVLIKELETVNVVNDFDLKYNGQYYITIENGDIIGGFKAGNLYKVQLRFSSDKIIYDQNQSATFFVNTNLGCWSEWSTVCIIKPINPPLIYLDLFLTYEEAKSNKVIETSENNFYYQLADFIGVYAIEDSFLTLKNYRFRLLDGLYNPELNSIADHIIADSGIKTAISNNYVLNDNNILISCSLPYEFPEGSNQKYQILFEIETRNGYIDSKIYLFNYIPLSLDPPNGVLKTYVNEELGYIKLVWSDFQNNETQNIAIRRSDSKSNFKNWVDLKNFELYSDETSKIYYDFTAESGIGYQYLVQYRDSRGRRSTPLKDQLAQAGKATIGEWEHALLLETNGSGTEVNSVKQLKLKYDFQISSYKTNISESKTDTIGSKYPFIRRNGLMYYRSFPITGTITSYMDQAELFVTRKTLNDVIEKLGTKIDLYKDFKGDILSFVQNKYDYTYERKFRLAVELFLYNAQPKLYKSMQEGNIFIKLMEVSLTPKQELGRLIYTFSATAYEIDEPTIENFNKYGFLSVGTFNPVISYDRVKLGQLTTMSSGSMAASPIFKKGLDIIGAGSDPSAFSIASKYNYGKVMNKDILTDFYLTHLRLTIESLPYLILLDTPGHFIPYLDALSIKDELIAAKLYQILSTYGITDDTQLNIYLGTLFEINGEQIIISPPNNIYELKGSEVNLPAKTTTIIPAKDTQIAIDFIVKLHYERDVSQDPIKMVILPKVGQIYGSFSGDIINKIKHKYSFIDYSPLDDKYRSIKYYALSITLFTIDTLPRAVVDLIVYNSDVSQPSEKTIIINLTGLFTYKPDNGCKITELYIKGKLFYMDLIQDKRDTQYSSFEDITKPVAYGLYIINNEQYFYYKYQWYKVDLMTIGDYVYTDDGMYWDNSKLSSIVVRCPIEALVFYGVKVRSDFY